MQVHPGQHPHGQQHSPEILGSVEKYLIIAPSCSMSVHFYACPRRTRHADSQEVAGAQKFGKNIAYVARILDFLMWLTFQHLSTCARNIWVGCEINVKGW